MNYLVKTSEKMMDDQRMYNNAKLAKDMYQFRKSNHNSPFRWFIHPMYFIPPQNINLAYMNSILLPPL